MYYKTKGVCSKEICFDVEDGLVKEVKFTNGCDGNLQGISSLVKNMRIEDVIEKGRGTSCPDQLAKALEEYKKNN